MKRVIVIGGGPSGMMAAYQAKKKHPNVDVLLLEKNDHLGEKLLHTGGGRCNVSVRVSDEEFVKGIVKNGKFLYSALSNHSLKDVQEFLEIQGVNLKEEDHGRLFPKSNKAQTIVDMFEKILEEVGVTLRYNTAVHSIDLYQQSLQTTFGEEKYDYLICATGGVTFPDYGSDGVVHDALRQNGVEITPLLPAEVGLVSSDECIMSKELQGLSFQDVSLSILNDKGKKKHTITHDLLITHFGLSGPAALRSSFEVVKLLQKQPHVKMVIDFVSEDKVPKRMRNYLEKHELDLHAFEISICAARNLKQAFVTNGGVKVSQIQPQTMQLKEYPNVAICGELLDISGYTGGYNISAALLSGWVAGEKIIE